MSHVGTISGALIHSQSPPASNGVYDQYPVHSHVHSNSHSRTGAGSGPSHSRRVSYGATSIRSSSTIDEEEDGNLDGDVTLTPGNGYQGVHGDYEDNLSGVTWTYLSRLYLLIPLFTLFFFAGLVLLITFAWPPSKQERKDGQTYPHPFFWKPLALGVFTSCTVQILRVPVWVLSSFLPLSPTYITLLSTTAHTILNELLRLCSVTLITRSPASGFHSSYYLGLGWGAAEATWGIVQGYEQLSLYEDLLDPAAAASAEEGGLIRLPDPEDDDEDEELSDDGHDLDREYGNDTLDMDREAVTELERKVELLESARARRDLEELIGVSFPTIPFPIHILWRIDTLLLNLGLTLILSAYYFNPYPLYGHPEKLDGMDPDLGMTFLPTIHSDDTPSAYLWPVWVLVAVLHVCVSLIWKIVGRVGIGAVTWGGLIVALGTVFAGLGAWGGLV